MGKRHRNFGLGLGSAVALAACLVALANAQVTNAPPLDTTALDLSNLRLTLNNQNNQSVVIDFENVEGPQSGAGIELSNQYAESHGVTFGRGASVHFCARIFDDVQASLCPYAQAASGQRAAAHEVRSGGPAMILDFSRPVAAVAMKINPTGGVTDELFEARLNGFDASGARIAENILQFNWFQDAFTWPTSVNLRTGGAGLSRVTIELRRVSQNNQAVRFLIDDLALSYAPDLSNTPIIAALAEETTPPRLEAGPAALTVREQEAGRTTRQYKPASRVRSAVDWDGVDRTLGLQTQRDLRAAPPAIDRVIDRTEMPVIAPRRVDPGTYSLVGGEDSYHADFEVDGRAYSIYGTRVLTVVSASPGSTPPSRNLRAIETDYALIATFSLYGASFTLTRYCKNDSAEEDPECHDRDAIGEIAKDLVVTVGEAGRRRP